MEQHVNMACPDICSDLCFFLNFILHQETFTPDLTITRPAYVEVLPLHRTATAIKITLVRPENNCHMKKVFLTPLQ